LVAIKVQRLFIASRPLFVIGDLTRRKHLMPFETYLVESIKQMNALVIQADLSAEQHSKCLTEAAAIGCRTLDKLCKDPELPQKLEQAADVRIIARFMQRASEREQRRQRELVAEFRNIVEDPKNFEVFLELEREVMIRGGIPHEVVDLLIEASYRAVGEIKARAKPPEELSANIHVLRDRACLLFQDLKTDAVYKQKWGNIKSKIKIATVGIGGAALIGLNLTALAASLGMTTVGSGVSASIGGGSVSGAALEIWKPSAASAS
jgi:hypothetical protein